MKVSEIKLELPDTDEGKRVKEALAVTLYQEGILTQNEAGEFINRTMSEFQELLLKYGKPLAGGETDEELEADKAAYRGL